MLGLRANIGSGSSFSWSSYWRTRYPSLLVLTVDSDTQITANHTNNGIQDYDYISYEVSPNDLLHFTEWITAVSGTTSKALIGLTASTLYYVRIRYYRGTHYSACSNVDSDTTNANSALIAGWKFETNQVDYFQNTLADYGTLGTINFHSSIYYNGYTYIAYSGNDTDAYITRFKHSDSTWATPVKIGTNPLINADGHGAPAILIDSTGYIHCIFGAHVTAFQYFKSNNSENITAWTNMGNPCPTITCTYPQLMQMSGGTIYLFYRNKSGDAADRQWGYVTSTNGGTSWSAYTIVAQNDFAYCYFKKGIGDTIHCGITKGDAYLDRQNIYYMLFDGANWVSIDGDVQTLPLGLPATEILAYNSGAEWVPNVIYGWDSSNKPYILFTEGHGDNEVTGVLGTFTYKYLKHNGSSWVVYNIGATTSNWRNFATAIDVISSNVINIYIVRGEVSGAVGGDVEKWSTSDGGATWIKGVKIIKGRFLDPLIVKDYNVNARLLLTEFRLTSTQWINRAYLWGDSGFIKNPAMTCTPDITGKYDGTVVLNPSLVAGQYGNCFQFVAATKHYINILDNDVFTFNNGTNDLPYTMTGWLKCTGTAALQTLMSKRDATLEEWQMLLYNNLLYNQVINGATALTATAPFTTTGSFVFICMTYDGSKNETGMKIFINLTESQTVQTKTGAYNGMANKAAAVIIASQAQGTTNYYNGLLDEVKIWNKVLSPAEMTNVMNNVAGW
jgi:hypothetical protein